jgi:pimeloyl-ACP methyl ester carboxylesterase
MATFLLVHGTFAKSADWPALQDSVAEAAREAGESGYFQQVPWSGKNRAAAREAAASTILKSVQDIRSNSYNEKVFLIGHSHGGSAIAYFLKEHPEAAKTLAGCAFLSTPFVAIRPRTDPLWFIVGLIFFPYVTFISLWNKITSPEGIEKHLNTSIMNDALAYFFPIFSSCAIAALLWLALAFVKRATAPQQVEQSIRQQTADIPGGNYLFLRCSGDEAAAELG